MSDKHPGPHTAEEWCSICDSYADENQRLSDEIDRLRAEKAEANNQWRLDYNACAAERDRLRALYDNSIHHGCTQYEIDRLRAEVKRLEAVQSSCHRDIIRIDADNDRLRAENVKLNEENERLRAENERMQQAAVMPMPVTSSDNFIVGPAISSWVADYVPLQAAQYHALMAAAAALARLDAQGELSGEPHYRSPVGDICKCIACESGRALDALRAAGVDVTDAAAAPPRSEP